MDPRLHNLLDQRPELNAFDESLVHGIPPVSEGGHRIGLDSIRVVFDVKSLAAADHARPPEVANKRSFDIVFEKRSLEATVSG